MSITELAFSVRRSPPGDDHRDALRGHRLPSKLDHWLSACVIHGIRRSEAFATNSAQTQMTELSFAPVTSRPIMSNTVPEITNDDDKPYCIWYPDVASEETYRDLAKRYPDMRYVIGRACAVAGYNALYHELGLLPDVSIAEEARESSTRSEDIFDTIMRQPVCCTILNNYTRSYNSKTPFSPAFINGDTAIRATLDIRFRLNIYEEWGSHCFNIAEDYNIDEVSSEDPHIQELPPNYNSMLYTPILSHLPTINKNPLILMAAYKGNLDRYVRLRRPKMLHNEFAAWSLKEIGRPLRAIKTAALARFIMVKDLSNIPPAGPAGLEMPALIWWPLIPAAETLKELVRRRPDMKLQVAMACIAGDYRARQEQTHSWPKDFNRTYYVDYLEKRSKELGIDVVFMRTDSECEDAAVRDKEPTTIWLDQGIYELPFVLASSNPDGGVYWRGGKVNAARWQLLISSSEEMRQKAREEDGIRLYDDDEEVVPGSE
ncbi:hypothetical protein CSPAE12_09867 [Colletotrichum incanum]|nr:hypothetical protein CSPAE12_09867 [Colletotrichum incanum]